MWIQRDTARSILRHSTRTLSAGTQEHEIVNHKSILGRLERDNATIAVRKDGVQGAAHDILCPASK